MLTSFKNWIKSNYIYFLFFIATFIIVASVILCRPLHNLDEVWNYSFANNVASGLIPYRDFNMLQTPLLPIVTAFFLFFFGNELIVVRILGIMLISFIFLTSFLILRKCKVSAYYSIFCLFLFFIFSKEYLTLDYNFAILAITLFLIYREIICSSIKGLKYNFFTGLLCGLTILLKQSTGIVICLASFIYPIFLIEKKEDFKTYIKTSLIKLCGLLIPITILFVYLCLHNSLHDFFDYTILGIKTFTNSIPYTKLLHSSHIAVRILSIGLPIFALFSGIILYAKNLKTLFGFWFYSLASCIVIYPIADVNHFVIAIMPFMILFAYLSYCFVKYLLDKIHYLTRIKLFFKELAKAVIILFAIYYIFTCCKNIFNYTKDINKNHNFAHYSQIPISAGLQNKITQVDNYILSQDENVYILDAEASIYMISLNRYYKDFNLFLKGNLGSKGEDGQIEKIKNLKKGKKILIQKSSRNWQTPEKVISYIENNMEKIGEISIFNIYEIK